MSKYAPLNEFLAGQRASRVPMTFEEIEKLLGFELPPSKRYRAWWSNNPSNSVMTKAWLDAGYKTESVDLAAGKLVFRKDKSPPAGQQNREPPGPVKGRKTRKHPLFGCMKGTVTVAEGVDLTKPALADWDAVE